MTAPAEKLRIIVGGLVGQFPLGGVAWDYFHYVLGLHELGHDVYYHEDTWVWPYDPVQRTPTDSPDYTARFIGEFFNRYAPALSDRWHYLLLHDKSFGMTRDRFDEVARTADIFLNVSGACFFPDELSPRCLKVFLDTDPGYNQIMLHERFAWSEHVDRWCAQVAAHDRHLTYAENIFGPDCLVPRMNFDWRPTRCVVTLPPWSAIRNTPPAPDAPFTTVMTWDWFRGELRHNGVVYGTKVPEFEKFCDLPSRTRQPLLLAVGGHKAEPQKIRSMGWPLADAHAATLTPQAYQRFIADSFGEWSIAKNVYVGTRTGWFSCRTACYLAAGRPAVVQDTAWSRYVPSGRGVIAFNTMEECLGALDEVRAHPRQHQVAAYEVAREYLAPDRVLTPMIQAIQSGGPSRGAQS
jgi:hypothetical protein